jgi:putative addiction module killer protein
MKPVLDLVRYECPDGTVPLSDWLATIRDRRTQARIRIRIAQLRDGNFGDAKSVGEGVVELRIHVGCGHRIYCARHGSAVVVLLCGGSKKSQDDDIRQAKEYWNHWKRSL